MLKRKRLNMGWYRTREAWALLVVISFVEPGLCIKPPRSACSGPQLFNGRVGLQQQQPPPDVSDARLHRGKPAWIGLFELLSEEELRWWKEDMFGTGPEKDPHSQRPVGDRDGDGDGDGDGDNDGDCETTTTTTTTLPITGKGSAGLGRGRAPKRNGDGRSTALVNRFSRALRNARDDGVRALQTLAGQSISLRREGGVWLRRRWRTKAVYCLAGVYGLRCAWRLVSRIKANALSSGDVVLDAEDRYLASRGAILDTEGQILLLRLRHLGPPNAIASGRAVAGDTATASVSATTAGAAGAAGAAAPQQRSSETKAPHESVDGKDGRNGNVGDCGWHAVESSLRRAISLRYIGRRGGRAGERARYVEELAGALRGLEQARDEADMGFLGQQHASLVEQAVLIVQTRLCDACLRSLRDGLIRASSDLSGLSSFWNDQRLNHRRMGVVKSIVLGRLVHGQASGKRAAVGKDQEKMSTTELLLEGYVKRLGTVQAHLQARPKACLVTPESPSTTTAAGGGTFTPGAVEALEGWIDEGMAMFLESLEHVEAVLKKRQPTGDKKGHGHGDHGNTTAGGGGNEPPPPEIMLSVDVASGVTAAAGATAAVAKKGSGMSLTTTHGVAGDTIRSDIRVAIRGGDGSNPLMWLRAGGGGGSTPLLSSWSSPSSATGSNGGIVLSGSSSLLSSTSTLTTDINARALQRNEDYVRRRRLELSGRRDGERAASVYEPKAEGDDNCSIAASRDEPSLNDNDDAPTADTTNSAQGVGTVAARVDFCAKVAEDISRVTVAVLSSPARLVRAMGSAALCRTYLNDNDRVLASLDEASSDDKGAPIVDSTNTQEVGTLAACVDRYVDIILEILLSAVVVLSSPVRLVRAVAGSAALSRIDLDDDDEETTTTAGAAVTDVSKEKPFGGAGEEDDKANTNGAFFTRDSPPNRHEREAAAAAVHSSANDKLPVMDLDDGDKQPEAAAGAEAEVVVAGRRHIGERVARPFRAIVVRPCAYMCGLVVGRNETRAITAAAEVEASAMPPTGKLNTSEIDTHTVETIVLRPYAFIRGLVAGPGEKGAVAAAAEVEAVAMAAGKLNISEVERHPLQTMVVRPCAHVCGLVGGGASACYGGLSACCEAAARAVCGLGAGALTVGSRAFRGVETRTHKCAKGAGHVLFSPVKLARAAASKGLPAIGSGASAGCGVVANAAARLKRRCGHLCILVKKGVSSGCVAAAASVCLAGCAVVKGVKNAASFCGECACCARRTIAVAPGKLSRTVVKGGGRAGRAAGSRLGSVAAMALTAPGTLSRTVAAASGRAGRSAGRAGGNISRAVTTGSGRAGRSIAAAVTAWWLATAASACMLGDAAAQGAAQSTRNCFTCVRLAARVLFVLPAKTAVRIADIAARPFSSDGTGDISATEEKMDNVESSRGSQNELTTDMSITPPVAAKGLKSAASWFKQRATRAAAYPVFSLGRRLSPEDNTLKNPIPATSSPSLVGDDEVVALGPSSSPPPSRAQEAEAALARWVSSAPAVGISDESGRRSRTLVGGAARAGRIAATHGSVSSVTATATPAAATGLTRAVRALATKDAAEAGAARPAYWKSVRLAAKLAVVVPLGARSAWYVQSNRVELGRVTTEAATGVTSFFSDQLWQPCEAIAKQVFFRERSNLMDEDSLADAETSLQNMLRDFVHDTHNEIPEDLRDKAVETMDMSVVSRELEKETKSSILGTVNGRIPRILLIQATFLKKELLHSMQSIDELFQTNQVTLRLISVIPAALLIFALARLSKPLMHAASSRRLEPAALVHRSMRASLREIERLLTSSSGFVKSQQGLVVEKSSAGLASRGYLEEDETGQMALHLHELQTTLRQNRSRFSSKTMGKLEEDLTDLMSRDRPAVVQQLAVLHRMQRSYTFLRADKGE